MCGIVAYVGKRKALPILMEGLSQLEYRGYDSAGVGLVRQGGLDVYKRSGKLAMLRQALPKRAAATCGVGHTRWATHGAPNDVNAHPHTDAGDTVAVVHNGIVENADELRRFLSGQGVTFRSETDTEVLASLIAWQYRQLRRPDVRDAVCAALRRVAGAYGIAVLHVDHPGQVVAARNGSAMVLGVGDGEMFAASDAQALAPYTRQVVYLEDGDIASLTPRGFEVLNLHDGPRAAAATEVDLEATLIERGAYAHFTLKEIMEQPEVLRRALSGRLDPRFQSAHLGGLNLDARTLAGIRRIKILGCGSAHIAGSIGAAMIERLARLPADAESAAEFRYRNPIIEADTLYLAVSQSGETFDTLSAVQELKRKGAMVLGVVNVVGSSIARACGAGIYLHAGPEVAVVSTKTFASTLVVFALLALHLARMRDLAPAEGARLVAALEALPDAVADLLERRESFRALGEQLAAYRNAYFIGRGEGYGLAREGALKLKEISYIHAEAYPASELKHGPLALIDAETPTLALLPDDDLLAKNLSTLQEIRTRGGPLLVIGQTDDPGVPVDAYVRVPHLHPLLDVVLMLIPLQFVAYYAALARGCDVDQPRNLAKSVTVE